MRKQTIRTPFIRLDAFLKLSGLAPTGGQAKQDVQAGGISVNGGVCTARGRKLVPGDIVEAGGDSCLVEAAGETGP